MDDSLIWPELSIDSNDSFGSDPESDQEYNLKKQKRDEKIKSIEIQLQQLQTQIERKETYPIKSLRYQPLNQPKASLLYSICSLERQLNKLKTQQKIN